MKLSTGTVGLAVTKAPKKMAKTKVLKKVKMATCCQNQY